jgi:hypothetical protein
MIRRLHRLHRLRRLLLKADYDLGVRGVLVKGTVSIRRRRGLPPERNLCNLRNLWIITLLRDRRIQSEPIFVHPEFGQRPEVAL